MNVCEYDSESDPHFIKIVKAGFSFENALIESVSNNPNVIEISFNLKNHSSFLEKNSIFNKILLKICPENMLLLNNEGKKSDVKQVESDLKEGEENISSSKKSLKLILLITFGVLIAAFLILGLVFFLLRRRKKALI